MYSPTTTQRHDTAARPASTGRIAPANIALPPAPVPARVVDIAAADLPLACPRRGDPVAFDHPRVYLEALDTGEALCPYCSTLYRLRTAPHLHDHQFGGSDLHQHRPPLPHRAAATRGGEPAATQAHPAGVVDRAGRTTLEQITDWLRGLHR